MGSTALWRWAVGTLTWLLSPCLPPPHRRTLIPGPDAGEGDADRQAVAGAAWAGTVCRGLASEYVYSGGLISYGVDHAKLFRRAAEYVDKILRGANPAELPIEQPTQYVLVVNMKAAKALRLTIPEGILLRADEVVR